MSIKRYKMTNEQWEQISSLFQFPKQDVRQRVTGLCLMLFFGLPEAVLHGATFLNVMVLGMVYSHFCK